MLLMLDFMNKYYIVKPELKQNLFNAYKSLNKNIDYEDFQNQTLYNFEEITCERFQKLNCSTFEEFEKYLKGEKNVSA